MPVHPGVGPSRTRSLTLALLASTLAGPLVAQEPASSPRFLPGARVDVLSSHLGGSWVQGQVGTMGKCHVVYIKEAALDPDGRAGVSLATIDSLRVSSLYDGLDDPDHGRRAYSEGASLEGEQWIPVSSEELAAATKEANACMAKLFPPDREPPPDP